MSNTRDNEIVTQMNSLFMNALLEKDLAEVERLFDQPITPNINYEMVTAPGIMLAAQQEDWKMVSLLYSLEADLNVGLQPENWTLLHECIGSAPKGVINALLEYADITVKTETGENLLMTAIRKGKLDIAQKLLDMNKISIDAVDEKKQNIAHYAAKYEHYDFLLLLVEKGVPLLQKNKEQKTPLDLIKDENFRMRLPQELQNIADSGKQLVLEAPDEPVTIKVSKVVEVDVTKNKFGEIIPKLSGLSTLRRQM